jgi:hypothetical protein
VIGYVYLLLEVDKYGYERHKIGFSKNDPNKRLKSLSTGNSNQISLLKFYQSPNYKKIEKWLHKKFNHKRTEANNEWFQLDNDDVINFTDYCKEIDNIVSFMLKNNPFYN